MTKMTMTKITMKKFLNVKISAILLLLFTISFNSNAILITSNVLLNGVNNIVDITEVATLGGEIEYQLSILTADQNFAIYAFGVSNSSTGTTWASTTRIGVWTASQFSAQSWDSGNNILQLWGGDIVTTALGSFSSLFGNDLYVNFFWLIRSQPSGNAINANSTGEFFQSQGLAASDFIALNASGSIIDQSKTAAVPEPSTLIIFVLGLGILSRRSLIARLQNTK
ncbi:MAG: hypothetical protein COB35_04120 [Gammaproteobacteria bacterium]|nr:MAG: hypothetical protein COB35_04120 [Gammaproteobacteria bacterium]